MDEYDLIVDALHAVRMVRKYSPAQAAARVDDIVKMLRASAENLPPLSDHQPLRSNKLALAVADALQATYGSRAES